MTKSVCASYVSRGNPSPNSAELHAIPSLYTSSPCGLLTVEPAPQCWSCTWQPLSRVHVTRDPPTAILVGVVVPAKLFSQLLWFGVLIACSNNNTRFSRIFSGEASMSWPCAPSCNACHVEVLTGVVSRGVHKSSHLSHWLYWEEYHHTFAVAPFVWSFQWLLHFLWE